MSVHKIKGSPAYKAVREAHPTAAILRWLPNCVLAFDTTEDAYRHISADLDLRVQERRA